MAENTILQNILEFIPRVRGAGFQQLNRQIKSTHQNLFSLKNLFTSFIGYDIYSGLRNLIPSLVETSQQLGAMKSRFNAVSESASAGADELNWIGAQSKRLGLDFLRTADDYSIFFATVSKNMGQAGTRKVFEQWAETFRVLHIDPERQTRVLYALREMSSKGKIYMQDLALQLGSAVPDAMNIAAKSMGYTGPKAVEKFRTAIKGGKVDVKKFIPLFSEAVNKQYVSQKALAYAMKQTDAQLQTIKTHWTFIQKNILESGMQDDIIKFLENTNKLLGWLEKHSKGLYASFKILLGVVTLLFGVGALGGIVKFLGTTSKIIAMTKAVRGLGKAVVLLQTLGMGGGAMGTGFGIILRALTNPWVLGAVIIAGLVMALAFVTKNFFPNVWKTLMAYWVLFQNLVYSLLDSINNHPAIKALKEWFGTDKNVGGTKLPKSLEQQNIESKYPQFQFLATMANAKDAMTALPFMPGGGLAKYPGRMLGTGLQQSIQNFFQPKNTYNMTINSAGAPEDVAKEVDRKIKEQEEKQKKSFATNIVNSLNFSTKPLGYLNR